MSPITTYIANLHSIISPPHRRLEARRTSTQHMKSVTYDKRATLTIKRATWWTDLVCSRYRGYYEEISASEQFCSSRVMYIKQTWGRGHGVYNTRSNIP